MSGGIGNPIRTSHSACALIAWGLLFVLLTSACIFGVSMVRKPWSTRSPFAPTPWKCIGGCGAGGSGGGSAGIRWVGEGVSGGRVRLECLPKFNIGENFSFLTMAPRLTVNLTWNTEVGLSVPIGYKRADVSYQANMEKRGEENGGSGDVSIDVTRSFGTENQYACQLALTMPTGRYDAADQSRSILPQSLQMGQGIYAATLGLSYTRDIDKGMLLFDGYFYYPFALSFTGKNAYIDSDYKAYRDATIFKKRFYYWFKPYGENDRGGYFPPAINLDGIYAYRGVRKLVQSFQVFFTAPLGVRWMPYYDNTSGLYDPRPDPDNRAWDVVVAYGVEFSSDRVPIFLGLGLPIHDKTQPPSPGQEFNQKYYWMWNGPDWGKIGREYLIAAGFKVALF